MMYVIYTFLTFNFNYLFFVNAILYSLLMLMNDLFMIDVMIWFRKKLSRHIIHFCALWFILFFSLVNICKFSFKKWYLPLPPYSHGPTLAVTVRTILALLICSVVLLKSTICVMLILCKISISEKELLFYTTHCFSFLLLPFVCLSLFKCLFLPRVPQSYLLCRFLWI